MGLKVFIFAILSILPSFGFLANTKEGLRSQLVPAPTQVQEVLKAPTKKLTVEEISSSSKAAFFIDVKSGSVLYQKGAHEKLPIASLTKLMTAIVTVSEVKAGTVFATPALTTTGLDSTMGLAPGDRLTVEELLHGLLINSGSDAAQTLAVGISGSEKEFAAKMNEYAKLFGLTETSFANASGTDDQGGYSSAADVAKIAKIALKSPQIKDIVTIKSYTASSEGGKKYSLTNTNKLLDSSFRGIKTGTTYGAGECLVSLYKEGDREIVGVLLGSKSRFTETTNVIKWTREAFSW